MHVVNCSQHLKIKIIFKNLTICIVVHSENSKHIFLLSFSDGPTRGRDKWRSLITRAQPSALDFLSRFLDHDITGILGQIIPCCAGCPVYCRMFYSILGLYPLGANSNPSPQVVTTQHASRHCQCPFGERGKSSPNREALL